MWIAEARGHGRGTGDPSHPISISETKWNPRRPRGPGRPRAHYRNLKVALPQINRCRLGTGRPVGLLHPHPTRPSCLLPRSVYIFNAYCSSSFAPNRIVGAKGSTSNRSLHRCYRGTNHEIIIVIPTICTSAWKSSVQPTPPPISY